MSHVFVLTHSKDYWLVPFMFLLLRDHAFYKTQKGPKRRQYLYLFYCLEHTVQSEFCSVCVNNTSRANTAVRKKEQITDLRVRP